MEKVVVIVVLLFTVTIQAQRKPKIKGNRNVVEVRESLPPFNRIVLSDDLEIVLQKSFEEGYTLKIDDNLIDVLKFKVSDSTLVISSFYKIIAKKKLDITVNYKELESISLNHGKISTKDVISGDRLRIVASGPARLELDANTLLTELMMEGISSGDLNLASDSLNIHLKDRIDTRIYMTTESASVTMNKNATARMEGTTENLQVQLFENTKLKAEKLEAVVVDASLRESSTARLNASGKLRLSSQGSSNTLLYGNSKIEILEFLDSSGLQKKTINSQ